MSHEETDFIPCGGASVLVRDSGTGQALVCLHAGVADHRMFAALHVGPSQARV